MAKNLWSTLPENVSCAEQRTDYSTALQKKQQRSSGTLQKAPDDALDKQSNMCSCNSLSMLCWCRPVLRTQWMGHWDLERHLVAVQMKRSSDSATEPWLPWICLQHCLQSLFLHSLHINKSSQVLQFPTYVLNCALKIKSPTDKIVFHQAHCRGLVIASSWSGGVSKLWIHSFLWYVQLDW